MFSKKRIKLGLMIFSLFALLLYVLEIDAFARAGGSRSSGSRGSRSYSSPSTPSKSATSQPRQVAPAPAPSMSQPQSGGFMRNMMGGLAGGIVGGMLGGMLFRSMGFAGGGGVGGGGIGLFDIVLIGLILYGIWWFIKKKRQAATEAAGPAYYRESSQPQQPTAYPSTPAYIDQQPGEGDLDVGLAHIRQMDHMFDEQRFKDQSMDNFFKVQGAWANRDLSSIRSALTDEMYGILQGDADELKGKKQINHLENIAVRTVEITEAWQETGKDFITVRFCANLLDYTVDEASGQVLTGSKTDPVKFDEYWTFTRPVGNNPWQLSAINQA